MIRHQCELSSQCHLSIFLSQYFLCLSLKSLKESQWLKAYCPMVTLWVWTCKVSPYPLRYSNFLMRYSTFLRSSEKKLEGPIFIGVSQRTRTDFLSQTKHRTYLTIFLFGAHGPFFIWVIVLENGKRWPIVWLRHPHFCRTEVSAHGPIFYRRQIVYDKKSVRLRWA